MSDSPPRKSATDTIKDDQALSVNLRVLAYISAYEASISCGACVSIGHDQHVPGFYGRDKSGMYEIDVRCTDVRLLDCE